MTPRLFLANSNCEDDFIIVYLNPRKNIWIDTENTCDGFELTEESWETFKQFIESLFKYKNSYQFKEDNTEDDEYLYRIREPLTEEEIEEAMIENARQEEWLKEKKRREKEEEDENENDDDEN